MPEARHRTGQTRQPHGRMSAAPIRHMPKAPLRRVPRFLRHGLAAVHDAPEVVHSASQAPAPSFAPAYLHDRADDHIGRPDVKLLATLDRGDPRPARSRRSSNIRSASPETGCEDLHTTRRGIPATLWLNPVTGERFGIPAATRFFSKRMASAALFCS